MTRINTNVSSLNAQKSLARSNSLLQEALTRLSTGLRINVGKDDPAGLIASEVLRSDINSTQKAISNTQRANQIIGTADSALGQVSALLNDIRGLIEEGANSGAMSDDQIAANQLQIDSSLAAINRISQTTKFQGRALLDGSLDFITSASTVTSLVDLQINQANLGATGQVDINVEISTAATQATVRSANGSAKAQAVVTFSPEFAYAADAVVDGLDLGIKAKALGEAYEGAKVTISDTGTASVTWDADAKTLVIGVSSGVTTYANIKNDLAAAGFEFFAKGDTTQIADANTIIAAAQVTLVNKTLTIDALDAGSTYNGMQVSLVKTNAVTTAAPRAAYYADTNRLIIEVSDSGDTAMADIEAAIDSNASLNTIFSATDSTPAGASTSFEFESTADVRARSNTLNSGYAVSGFSDATNANAVLSFAASAKIAISNDANKFFYIRSKSLGAAAGDVRITFQDTVGAQDNETATYDASAKTLIVTYESTQSTEQNILDAINALDDWVATTDGTAGTAVGAAQSAGITGVDSLNISAVIAGADFNQMKIEVATEDGLTTPRAVYNATANQLTITINSAAVTSLSSIATAINAVDGFAAGVDFNGARNVNGGDVDATASANTGSTGGNLLLGDLVMNVGGLQGTDVFKFSAGTAVNEIANAVNLVKDATGVSATQSNGLLTITSQDYGSKAFAAVNVVSEGTAGSFKRAISTDRANGTDIEARVNGFSANADGNSFGISVSTLDLRMEVVATTIGNFAYAITGGGAMFQMGPEVVTNQQARIGIGSMSTASLRGASGRLYELASGNAADLVTDAGKAAKIADEVISKVTSLRGRLGAFQRTTLDTNINTLTDTVGNLTAAESDIRDADFASESSKLTRAQILVQSGMTVLGIANQQPQQVLALLRG